RRAAEQLAAEAGNEPSDGAAHREALVLHVVDVPVSRPMVPDRGTESGALIVVGAGSWTAGELTGIAEACADAGHEVLGTVLAGTVWTRPKRTPGRSRRAPAPPAAVGAGTKGGAV
ncbi:polysaccharide biosynthesis protein, partial [Streptomyces sp. SID6041]|nr:polysaccharide biosynthesis protein [Streptomyces sp. SID6041]